MTTINVALGTNKNATHATRVPAKAWTRGHETFAVHRHIVRGEAVGMEYGVTHVRTGLSLTAQTFRRLQPARQVARAAHRIISEVGDFGEFGAARYDRDETPGYYALARLHDAVRMDRPWDRSEVPDEMVDAWVRYALT